MAALEAVKARQPSSDDPATVEEQVLSELVHERLVLAAEKAVPEARSRLAEAEVEVKRIRLETDFLRAAAYHADVRSRFEQEFRPAVRQLLSLLSEVAEAEAAVRMVNQRAQEIGGKTIGHYFGSSSGMKVERIRVRAMTRDGYVVWDGLDDSDGRSDHAMQAIGQ